MTDVNSNNGETARQRDMIMSAYPGTRWRQKVAKMPANQVVAVYLSFKKRGLVR